MITENIQALVAYRLEQADESLDAARILLDRTLDRSAVNRAYYAMFYAVLALLATRKRETSKHGGAISLFSLQPFRAKWIKSPPFLKGDSGGFFNRALREQY